MKRALLVGVVLLILFSVAALAGEFLMNDTGQTVYALTVAFSESVTITEFGDGLMTVEPTGESSAFTFSGGELETWGGHWLRWVPDTAQLLSVEWSNDAPDLVSNPPCHGGAVVECPVGLDAEFTVMSQEIEPNTERCLVQAVDGFSATSSVQDRFWFAQSTRGFKGMEFRQIDGVETMVYAYPEDGNRLALRFDTPYDASRYAGVQFIARAVDTALVQVGVASRDPGTHQQVNDDDWKDSKTEYRIELADVWTEYYLPFSDFVDPEWVSDYPDTTRGVIADAIWEVMFIPDCSDCEIQIQQVSFCNEGCEVARGKTTSGILAASPAFMIDPDVTRDSVVQIGNGPQELSTDIRFYPNARRAKPGDTVYWTLEIGEGSGLVPPFTIVPEMDNDAHRETEIRTESSRVTFEYTYEVEAVYVPYIGIVDAHGSKRTIYTHNVLGVVPDLEPRERIGIDIPTPEDPVGDYIKGVQVWSYDYTLLGSAEGTNYVKSQIDRWAETGVNFVMYNPTLFVDEVNSNVTLPLYGDVWPDWGHPSMTFDWMVALADWSHELGMRVAFRPFMVAKRDYDVGDRSEFDPTDESLYFDYHIQIKTFYAELYERLGVGMFCLDAENPVTSRSRHALRVLDAVRAVYTGIVTDSPTTDLFIAMDTPLWGKLDLIYFSYNSNLINLAGASVERMQTVLEADLSYRILPLLEYWQKPGLFEAFVQYSRAYPSHQRKGYEAQLEALSKSDSLLVGVTFWDAVLNPDDPLPHSPFGRTAEATISQYFNDQLPHQKEYVFGRQETMPIPHSYIDRFESQIEPGYFRDVWPTGGDVSFSSGTGAKNGRGCLRVDFDSAADEREITYGFFFWVFDYPRGWTEYGSVNFWYKSDGYPSDIVLNVFDADEQRYVVHVENRSYRSGWIPISVALDDFGQPSWMGTAEEGFDWSNVVKFGIAEIRYDGRDHTTYFDEIFLSRDAAL